MIPDQKMRSIVQAHHNMNNTHPPPRPSLWFTERVLVASRSRSMLATGSVVKAVGLSWGSVGEAEEELSEREVPDPKVNNGGSEDAEAKIAYCPAFSSPSVSRGGEGLGDSKITGSFGATEEWEWWTDIVPGVEGSSDAGTAERIFVAMGKEGTTAWRLAAPPDGD